MTTVHNEACTTSTGPTATSPDEAGQALTVYERQWNAHCALLQAWANKAGTANPPVTLIWHSVKLGPWTATQRTMHRTGLLSDERAKLLEALPGWTWNAFDTLWDTSYAALVSHRQLHGSVQIPKGHVHDGVALDAWCRRQRQSYRDGRLDARRVAALEAVAGWEWAPHQPFETTLALYAAHVAKTGTVVVPAGVQFGSVDGATWVAHIRKAFNRGELCQERIGRLGTVPGFTFDRRNPTWDEMFAALEAYVQRAGTADVPQKHVEESSGVTLGKWVANQRGRQAKLFEEQVRKLEALPGWRWAKKHS